MAVVVITEKPSAAKNFAKALGGMSGTFNGEKYRIVHAVGHVYELQPPEKQTHDAAYGARIKPWQVDNLPWDNKAFAWKLKVSQGKEQVVRDLNTELSRASEIVMACDVDPTGEGDAISGNIITESGVTGVPISRMKFLDESVKSLQKAFSNREKIPNFDTYGPYRMAQFRARFDWLFGLQYSRLATLKAGRRDNQGRLKIIRQGRLKSPIVLLVGNQLKAYHDYVKKPFFQNRFIDNHGITYTNPEEPTFETQDAVPQTYKASAVVHDGQEKKSQKPPKLIDLAALSARLAPRGYKPKHVLNVYQKMYEANVVSYPRTEDTTITTEQFNDMLPLIEPVAKVVGVDTSGLTHRQPRKTHVKDSGAHGANRPGPNVPATLSELDGKYGDGASAIYDILARSFLAMVSEDYEYVRHTGHVKDYPAFVGSTNVPAKMGWKAVYDTGDDDEDNTSEGLGGTAEPFVYEGANKRPEHPTIKWLIKQLEKRKVGTGATRTSTIADVSSGKTALLDEKRSKLTLTELGDIAYRMLPNTHLGSLDMTEKVFEWMEGIADGRYQESECLPEIGTWITEDATAMDDNADALYAELGLTRPAPAEYVHGTWNGAEAKFKRTWAGHRFTDVEIADLWAGKTLEIEAQSTQGKPFKCTGKLGEGEYKGKKTFGFQMENIIKPDQHTGFFKPEKKEVSFKKTWAGHTFTELECAQLLDGEEISFTAHGKKGEFTARGKLQKQNYKGKEFYGFALDTLPQKWGGHTFSDSERATLRRGGEVRRNDFVSKKGSKFAATLTYTNGKLDVAFDKKNNR